MKSLQSLAIASAIFLIQSISSAATVNYQGVISELGGYNPPGPLNDDWVIAGTWAPGFTVGNWWCVYGSAGCNIGPNMYSRAVADGVWRPIGSGTFANAAGAFSGSGTATGIDNLPIYFLVFSSPYPDAVNDMAIFSGSSAAWRVQNDGTTSINAASADIFSPGANVNGVIHFGLVPISEPGTSLLFGLGIATLCLRYRNAPRKVLG